MTNSYIKPTQPTASEPRYSQNEPAWQDVEIVDVPAVEEPEPAEGAPEPIRIIDEPDPGEATAGDAVIEYTRDHLPVNMGVDTNQSDFTREQAEQLVGDIQEQLYETAKSQKRLHDLIAQAYDGRAWIALGYPAGQIGWNRMCQDKFTADAVRLTVQQRTNLILSFQDDPISNVALAAALGVTDMTIGRVLKKNKKSPKGASAKPKPVVGTDGKRHSVPELTPAERLELDAKIHDMNLPVEEGGQGMTQQEIAAKLDMAQSTICASIKRETMRRMSEGLEPAAPAPVDETGAIGVLPDNTAIDLGGDRLAADDMNFVEAFRTAAGDANAGLARLVELMSSERWQPGSEIVDEIVTRAGRDIKGVLANVGPFMRLVDHDLEDMWPADENDRSRDQDEVNGLFDQILTVASECA